MAAPTKGIFDGKPETNMGWPVYSGNSAGHSCREIFIAHEMGPGDKLGIQIVSSDKEIEKFSKHLARICDILLAPIWYYQSTFSKFPYELGKYSYEKISVPSIYSSNISHTFYYETIPLDRVKKNKITASLILGVFKMCYGIAKQEDLYTKVLEYEERMLKALAENEKYTAKDIYLEFMGELKTMRAIHSASSGVTELDDFHAMDLLKKKEGLKKFKWMGKAGQGQVDKSGFYVYKTSLGADKLAEARTAAAEAAKERKKRLGTGNSVEAA